jgi:GTPase SAR1 family protein
MELSNRIVSPSQLVQSQGAKILVYGMAGSGKTTLEVHRWLQTVHSQGYKAKDRSGKLENFEKPDITTLIEKLGFSFTNDMGETNV